MTPLTKYALFSAVVLCIGAFLGWSLKGCTERKAVQTVVHDTLRSNIDSIRAVAYAMGREEARTITVRRDVTRDVFVPDPESVRKADSLLALIDSVLDARDADMELVATGYTKTDTYELSQIFRLRDRTFGHALTMIHADTTAVPVPCPDAPTFWDKLEDYGVGAAIGALVLGLLLSIH